MFHREARAYFYRVNFSPVQLAACKNDKLFSPKAAKEIM